VGKRQKHGDVNLDGEFDTRQISAIHLAATSGDPETLRLFITNQKFDPLVTCHGATSLHFAVASRPPFSYGDTGVTQNTCIPNYVMQMEDFGDVDSYGEAKVDGAKNPSYKGRESCISILVQAGVDVWEKDDGGNFPEPGRLASSKNIFHGRRRLKLKLWKPRKALMKLAMRSPLWLLWLPLHLMWVLCNHLLVMQMILYKRQTYQSGSSWSPIASRSTLLLHPSCSQWYLHCQCLKKEYMKNGNAPEKQ
jgi:hypothetical protein